jgi:hypothetical protein
MKLRFVLAFLAAAFVLAPTAAHAQTAFYADSGDACRYGFTEGVFEARLSAVHLKGTLTDRPVPAEPFLCRDDGFFTIGTYSAYLGTRLVDQQVRRVDNGVLRFELALGPDANVSRIDRLVIQVCRSPLNTLPPSYCGRPVEYRLG